jgi:signal transduction histidine kinase
MRDFLPLSAVCAMGLMLAVAAFLTVRGYYQAQAQQQFRRTAAYYSTSFKDDVARHVTSLGAIRAFVSASKDVTRWEFSSYAHQILPQNLGFRSVLWVPSIAQGGRAAYETALQQDGLYGLRIRDLTQQGNLVAARERKAYLPISYVEPFDGNDKLVGLDLAPIAPLDQMFQTAQRSGRVAASPPLLRNLVAGTHGPVVLLALPLSAHAAKDAAAPQGYALGVLQLQTLIGEAIGASSAPVQAAIAYQAKPGSAPMVLDGGASTPAQDWFAPSAFHQTLHFDIAGRPFLLALRSTGHADAVTEVYVPLGAALLVITLMALLAQNMSTTIRRKRLVERAVILRTTELRDANASLRDEVEQRRQAEADLRIARDRAESASRAKSAFMATMSHELRTPLNSIIGFSSILAQGKDAPAPRQREYAGEILGSGKRLLELINDILDLTQMDRHPARSDDTLVYLADCAAQVVQDAQASAAAGGVLLKAAIPDALPALYGDGKRLTRALAHLVSNAVKFTPKGGAAVITAAYDHDGALVLDVTDTGVGMDLEAKVVARQAFAQHDDKLGRKYEGIGLGLTYVSRVAELHDAELTIVSEAGKGTRVRLIFPHHRIAEQREVA